MLGEYINAAMRRAHYEILEDQTYYGEIECLGGVFANAETLEECREQFFREKYPYGQHIT